MSEVYWTGNIKVWHPQGAWNKKEALVQFYTNKMSFDMVEQRPGLFFPTESHIYSLPVGNDYDDDDYDQESKDSQEDVVYSHICTGVT